MHRTTICALLCLVVITASAGNWFPLSSTYKTPSTVRFQPYASLKTEIAIYVLEIPEVSASVGSVSSFLTGIKRATQSSFMVTYRSSGEIESATNVTYSLVILSDWKQYRDLILTGNNFILVNSHADYLPVPAGYNQTQWFNMVLDAISNRYATWVHVEGFPFHKAWIEGVGPSLLGAEPFHQLASLAGFPSSIPASPRTEYYATGYLSGIETFVGEGIAILAYKTYSANYSIELPNSFPPSLRFRAFYSRGIDNATYRSPGVVIRVNGKDSNRYGLYVHFVPETFSPGNGLMTSANDTDLVRGAVGTAMALEWQIEETVNNIVNGAELIDSRQAAGMTSGLDLARRYLSSAQSEFQSGQDLSAWLDASRAVSSAQSADLPWPLSALAPYWPYIAVIGGMTLLMFLITQPRAILLLMARLLSSLPGRSVRNKIMNIQALSAIEKKPR